MASFAQTGGDLFSSTIRPALERDCQGCHGAAMAMGRLDLRTRESLLRGGARGPAMVPGKADASLLIQAIEGQGDLQMPPGGAAKRLSPELRVAFRQWIDAGAPWSDAKPAANWGYQPADLWAFRPVPRRDRARIIDSFIDAALAKKGLTPAARADRATLLRRVTYDLTGLPPTPAEVDAFLRDRSRGAWERVVERLLASPGYGERWGRHWLDVVRYADTGGYSNDFERPNAWRYRDYVIRSFQNDKPYDRFLLEQVAGDELFPGDAEALIATGFLRAGPWEHTAMSVEAVTRQMFLDDVTHATATTFLAMTAGCARCHDHKFDPIPTRDYYRLQAVFASTEFARPALPFLPAESTADLAPEAARLREIAQRTARKMEEYNQGRGLSPEKSEEFKLYQKHMQLYRESLDRFEPKAFAVSSGPLDGATDGGMAMKYPKRADYRPAVVRVLPGGNLQSPAEEAPPGVLSALEQHGGYSAPLIPPQVQGRRAALARWMASGDNPLTARVMANRVWQYHFGRGLAANANNFGKMGARPTHPELLDWLAALFVESGWSVKALHRAILHSEVYQRAATPVSPERSRNADPSNLLLGHFEPRRLEAEELRDSVLAVSGELSAERGGPGTFPEINEDVARQPQHRMGSLAPAYAPSPRKAQRHRRTIYTFQQRSLPDPLVEVFNGPSADLSCEMRESSTVPTQAFALINSRFLHDAALAMAARAAASEPDARRQTRLLFRLAFSREPSAPEMEKAQAHLARMTQHHRATPPPAEPAPAPLVHQITSELTGEVFQFVQQPDPTPYEANLRPAAVSPAVRALADLALVLLNANEFVYVY